MGREVDHLSGALVGYAAQGDGEDSTKQSCYKRGQVSLGGLRVSEFEVLWVGLLAAVFRCLVVSSSRQELFAATLEERGRTDPLFFLQYLGTTAIQ